MSRDYAIKVGGVDKTFKLPHEKVGSVKSAFLHFSKKKRGYEMQHVLKDISFEIKKGDFFGIVGRNGSGKSTLLKLLAGIYTPDEGSIDVNGTLTPFIELGVGFSPELSGRENVFLNGALLGFSRTEMEEMYTDIVDFAELERFMDQKLKNYSSGMQVRLAFSIAIRARSDILLLDEVLAVGDEAFQRKCFAYFETLKRNKKTVVLVTHDMSAVEKFCNRAIFIEDGQIKLDGKPHEVAAAYSRANDLGYDPSAAQAIVDQQNESTQKKSEIDIILKNSQGNETASFTSGDTLTVELHWKHDNVQHAGVSILKNSGEYIYGQNTYHEKFPLKGAKNIAFEVKLDVFEGDYFIVAGLFGKNDSIRIDFEEQGPNFTVNRDKSDVRWGGMVKLSHMWKSLG